MSERIYTRLDRSGVILVGLMGSAGLIVASCPSVLQDAAAKTAANMAADQLSAQCERLDEPKRRVCLIAVDTAREQCADLK